MPDSVKEHIRRGTALRSQRGQWDRHWEDLARVQLPRRLGFVSQMVSGERRTEELYDGTAIQSASRLANIVGGMLRPEGEDWAFIKTVDDADGASDEAKEWLADSQERLHKAFDNPKARLRQASGEIDLDTVVLGTGIGHVREQIGKQALLFQSSHLKDAVPFFGEEGNLAGMYRWRSLKVRQAHKMFGSKLSPETLKLVAEGGSKLDQDIEFLFVVIERKEGRADAVLARNLPFADIVIEVRAEHEVDAGGFHEMPYFVARWDTSSGEDYGRSPGMVALPDSNTSQAIGETMLVAGQRAADPPMLVPDNAFIDAPNTYPGGLGYYNSEEVQNLRFDPFKLLETGRNFPLTRDIQQDTREMIRSAFLLNLFNLPVPGDATMTATEVNARLREFVREMGPVFGRVEADYTAPMVERSFKIMLRAGAFLPPPDVWAGRNVQVRFEYESPVKRLREQAAAAVTDEWVKGRVELSVQTGDPALLDVVNFDAASRFIAEAQGVPLKVVNGQDRVTEIREERAEQKQAEELTQDAQTGAEVLDKVAGAAQKASGAQAQRAPAEATQ